MRTFLSLEEEIIRFLKNFRLVRDKSRMNMSWEIEIKLKIKKTLPFCILTLRAQENINYLIIINQKKKRIYTKNYSLIHAVS
jgi:hypothetical protein